MAMAERLLHASFNQDKTYFSVCTKDGYKIFNCESGHCCYEKSEGAMAIVEMLYRTNLLTIVGAGEQPTLSPRRLCLFNTVRDKPEKELTFLTSILSVRLNREWLLVVLQQKTYIYDLNSVEILEIIDTVPNKKGLCAFSPSQDNCFIALPASSDKGDVLVYNVKERQSHCQINAHNSPLAAMALSNDGHYLATASEQGTIIRVFYVPDASKMFSFRRGAYPATIYSLSFGPATQSPQLLLCSSATGSLHIFTLGLLSGERNKRSTGVMSIVFPESVNDALESPYHHIVLQNLLPQGFKSSVAISHGREINADEGNATGKMPGSPIQTLRTEIYAITYGGYFSKYCVTLDSHNGATWNLESECNLISAPADEISAGFVH